MKNVKCLFLTGLFLAAGGLTLSFARGAGHQYTIAMMPKSKGNAYFIACQQGAQEAARELGVNLIWDGPTDPDPASPHTHCLRGRFDFVFVCKDRGSIWRIDVTSPSERRPSSSTCRARESGSVENPPRQECRNPGSLPKVSIGRSFEVFASFSPPRVSRPQARRMGSLPAAIFYKKGGRS